jgi:hypothetical protein
MPTTDELLHWLERSRSPALYRRLNATAIRSLEGARSKNEPDDVEWLARNANVLAQRLAEAGKVTASTATTYASRLRNVGRQFLRMRSADEPDPRDASTEHRKLAQMLARVPPPISPAQEIAEAMMFIGRWPSLGPDLVPALARAMNRLGISKGTE